MRLLARIPIGAFGLVVALVVPTLATVPGGIDIACDVPRTGTLNFRTAASGQTTVAFKLWSAATGGSQLGSDYTVLMTNLAVAKRYTDKYDSVRSRKAMRINAVIGSDGSPALLPADGQAWLEVLVGTTTLGCNFAATGDVTARKRLQSAPYARECETCQGVTDISVRVLNTTDILVPSSVNTPLTFDTEQWDTDNMHSTTVNSSRLTANTAGKYYIFGAYQVHGIGDSTNRNIAIRLNGGLEIVTVHQNADFGSFGSTDLAVSTHYQLNVGDYVELVAQQSSGSTVDVFPGPGTPAFGMVKLP